MNRILLYLMLSSITGTSASITKPTCLPFDYIRDISAIQKLLKKEWKHLFLSPSYDEQLVHKLFFKKLPGDTSVINTAVNIDVLYAQEQFAGFITYYVKKNHVGHIELLAIEEAYRKNGYGGFLIEHTIARFKGLGCNYVQLYVYLSNPRAITFYEHLGFTLKANFGAYILLNKNI